MVKVAARDADAEQLEIKKELVFVIDEMLDVSEQNGQSRLAFRNEDCRQEPCKISIRDNLEAFPDMLRIIAQALARLFDPATMIHRQPAQA